MWRRPVGLGANRTRVVIATEQTKLCPRWQGKSPSPRPLSVQRVVDAHVGRVRLPQRLSCYHAFMLSARARGHSESQRKSMTASHSTLSKTLNYPQSPPITHNYPWTSPLISHPWTSPFRA